MYRRLVYCEYERLLLTNLRSLRGRFVSSLTTAAAVNCWLRAQLLRVGCVDCAPVLASSLFLLRRLIDQDAAPPRILTHFLSPELGIIQAAWGAARCVGQWVI